MERTDKQKMWSSKVGKVFNTMPRDGNHHSTVWLTRKVLEKRFSALLSFPGVHICLDGPTGTGKSSLALTELNKANLNYKIVQITKFMNWGKFCQEVVSEKNRKSALNGNKLANLANEINKKFNSEELSGLCYDLDIDDENFALGGKKSKARELVKYCDRHNIIDSLVDKLNELRDGTDWKLFVEEMESSSLQKSRRADITEHDICEFLSSNGLSLLIDDFERSNQEIVERIADMCKLLTESYVHPSTKLIIVGTDDIYKRLYEANPSLEGRLEELSVGTLPSPEDSWKFLQIGFEKLKLRHPAMEAKENRFSSVTQDDNLKSMRAVYEAANGLPKSLNELGRDISLTGIDRKRISPDDVIKTANKMPQKALSRFKRKHREIIKMVEADAAIRIVLQELYQTGIGQIHHWSEIVSSLTPEIPESNLNKALSELVSTHFLVQTGWDGDVLFVSDPRMAHTLGVVIENPEKYGQKAEKYAPMGQLTLPFDMH